MNLERRDSVRQLMRDLADVHAAFRAADEVYREYRTIAASMFKGREDPSPTEWIPISNN